MSGPPAKMHKGIQFVKSSDKLEPPIKDAGNVSQLAPPSHSSALLDRPSSTQGGVGRGLMPRPSFGGPAINFGNRYNQTFVKSGESYSSLKNEPSSGNSYRMPGFNDLNQKGKGKPFIPPIPITTTVKPVCSKEEYLKAWKDEKDPLLIKIRKLAYEIVSLKTDRPNAMDKLHSAANKVPIRIEFNTEPIMGPRNSRSFRCFVFTEGVDIATGQGSKIRGAKAEAYEIALQKIFMPYMRIVSLDPTSKQLEVSQNPFTSPPRAPSMVPLHNSNNSASCQHKESNMEAAGLKRRYNEYKNLDEFVIVEPKFEIPDCTAAHNLRRSADFNHMLLEYEYFFKGESARCILKIENETLADVNGVSKAAAKNNASAIALARLKEFCWIIKTKKAVDSNSTISKDEILNELSEQSESIDNDNIGNKMLRKMGWSGGGVGKDGDGIAEPVSLKSVLNREGLGLGTSKGITDDFKRRIKEVIENYAASNNQEDLVFSADFRLEERQIIHNECRRLNLRSKSKGKGGKRYLVVRRKRSVNQLFDHLMSVGGETTRYQLVPPGTDRTPTPQRSIFPKPPAPVSSSSPKPLMSANNFVSNSQSPRPLLQTPVSNNGMTNNVPFLQNLLSNNGIASMTQNNSNGSIVGRGGHCQPTGMRDLNRSDSDVPGHNFGTNQSNCRNAKSFITGYGDNSYNQPDVACGGFRNNGNGGGNRGNHNQQGMKSDWGPGSAPGINNKNNPQGYNNPGSYKQNINNSNPNIGRNDKTSHPPSGQWNMRGQDCGQGFGCNESGQGYGNFGLSQGFMNNGQGRFTSNDYSTNTFNNNNGPGFGMEYQQTQGYSNVSQGMMCNPSHSHHPTYPSHRGGFHGGFSH